ncbi:hypothetical protein TNIN_175321 [Trichonephila inaurata madagascariensis]|uniref:Uncharacterized protein n=1 Tax=Trichonephila inaurata madagascariensis TaxID=2747483 RepID=A0A8X6XXJ5_9ARAC|nr:hypothetical protein TNIN_175321 [Trichonephila inaurata madagascariensis]
METLIQKFIFGVQKAAKASIPRGRRKNNWVPCWRDHNLGELIRVRDAARHETEKNNSDEKNLIDISRKVEDEIAACKRKKWIDLCGRLYTRKDYHHWRVITTAINKIIDQLSMPLPEVDIHPKLTGRLQTYWPNNMNKQAG